MFSTSYTVLNSYELYNIRQVFFTIIYLKEFGRRRRVAVLHA
jgi:hypothetical protein